MAVNLVKEILSDTTDADNLSLCRVLKDFQIVLHPQSIKLLRILTEDLEKVCNLTGTYTKSGGAPERSIRQFAAPIEREIWQS